MVAAFTTASIAPVGEGGMASEGWIEGMDPENVAFTRLEIAGDEPTLTVRLEEERVHIAEHVADPPGRC